MTRPRSLGRFQVLSTLGRGGMGTVYLAEDPVIGRRVAIKEILVDPTGGNDERASQYDRFVQEFRSAGALSHPNIVTIYDVGQVDGAYFIAMELVTGESLAQRLRREPRPEREWVVDTARQVAEGLDHAHRLSVLHRDVKPGNILLGEDQQVKLTDFGIAKLLEADRSQPATVVGTPGYMSPEQVRGRALGGRSDQFSLAVLLYQMLVGVPPYRGESMSEVIYQLLHKPPKTPSACQPDLPACLDGPLLRALALDPADRFPTCRAMVDAVGASFDGQRPPTPSPPLLDEALTLPVGRRPRREPGSAWRSPWALSLGLVLVVALAAAFGAGIVGSRPEIEPETASSAAAPVGPAMAPDEAGHGAGDGADSSRVEGAGDGPANREPISMPASDADPLAGPAATNASPPTEPPAAVAVPIVLGITSAPAGAKVLLDGADTGKTTPAQIAFAADTAYRLEIALPGYATAGWRFTLADLDERQRTDRTLHFPLATREPRSTLAVSAGYPVAVEVGGRLHRPSARHEIDLAAGRYEVRLRSAELFLDRAVPLHLQPGERTPLQAPAAVTIRLAAQPGNCTVKVGGAVLTDQPPLNLRIAAGQHTFVFTWPDGRSRRISTAVTEGQRIFGTPP